MNQINLPLKNLIPYERNAKKHDKKQIDNVARSISEFGFVQPIVVGKDNNIIIGHCRALAAKKLKLDEVPCVKLESLSEDEVNKLRLLDNKLNESDWDFELLTEDIPELDFSGFDIDWKIDLDFGDREEKTANNEDDNGYYGDERRRTTEHYNMALQDEVDFTTDFWQMPIIRKCDFKPDDLIGFNYAKTSENKSVGIHCFVDDYQFERLWSSPDDYIDLLKDYQCFLSPDFSLYTDMMMATKIYNVYRSRLIGAYYQARGIKVIPTISWAEPATYEFCFKGIEKGGIVAVSTIGVKKDKNALRIWYNGMKEMIKQLEPKKILVYGGKLDFDYGDIEVIYYDNHVTKEWSETK